MLSDYQIQRLLDTANALCHNGIPGVARKVYSGVLALKPGFPPALIGQALSHIVVDEFDKAEEILSQYLEKTPDDSDAQAFLGLTYMFSGRKDEAAILLEKVAGSGGVSSAFAEDVLKLMSQP